MQRLWSYIDFGDFFPKLPGKSPFIDFEDFLSKLPHIHGVNQTHTLLNMVRIVMWT